jgi:nicotinamidase-related amidase
MSMNNSALLLIEFQNEWLDEKGKINHLFIDRAQFLASVENAKKVLEHARNTQLHIIHSGLTYTNTYKELGEAKHGLREVIPKNRTFLKDSYASQFPVPFTPRENEFVVQGRIGSSAFSGSNLDAYLRNNHVHTLYIMGYALQVCVESTLRAAHDLGYEVVIIEDACSAFTQEQKKHFLSDVLHHFGCSIKSEDFVAIPSA